MIAALVLAVLATEFLRARLEESEALRESVEAAARAQLGLELATGRMEVVFWPAGLRFPSPVLDLPGASRVAISDARVHVDLRSLLGGNARVRGLSVAGPARLDHPQLGSSPIEGDLTVSLQPGGPPLEWVLELDGRLTSGGTFSARGGLGAGGAFDGSIEMEAVEGAPFAPFLTSPGLTSPGLTSSRVERARLAGLFGGSFELPKDGQLATLRLTSPEAEIAIAPIVLRGPVALVATLPSPSSSDAGGRFAVDASGASVEYAGRLAKVSGQGASLTGRIVRDPGGGLRLEEVGLKVQRFRGEVPAQGEPEDRGASDVR